MIIEENLSQVLLGTFFDQVFYFLLCFLFFLSLQSFKSLHSERNFFKSSMENIVENLDLAVVIKSDN